MSRSASRDLGYSAGLIHSRSSNDRDHFERYNAAPSSSSFGTSSDRPGPQTPISPPATTQRSIAGYEHNEYGTGAVPDRWSAGPNKYTPPVAVQHFSSFNHNHHSPHPPSPPGQSNALYHSPIYNERDAYIYRNNPQSPPPVPPNLTSSRSTLWWGDLEPWMDGEYAKQVCGLMGWDPVNIKVPQVGPDDQTGQQANNPGYCFLTFPSHSHAASVLGQVNDGNGNTVSMPNSTKPFVFNWASSVPAATAAPAPLSSNSAPMTSTHQPYSKEYSIFVGDLAPETSNSDLVAVFRNPVLGLRNDREPKFIRPFLSCKSAKIMLDPVTGVSRGYGFVRFTEESDQQRALIEMHGLYCLSRPMRISPATAKFKPPPMVPGLDIPHVQFSTSAGNGLEQQPVTIALPLPSSNQINSVSAPIAATSPSSSNSNTIPASGSGVSMSGSNSTSSLSSGTGSSNSISSSVTTEDMLNLPHDVLAQIAQRYANGTANPPKQVTGSAQTPTAPFAQGAGQEGNGAPRYMISEESWKHHAQARAILGNLIGPNGEQLTSTDPYNTTVFVGGLSPLISEETLRTFFAPFGDIHYVKVPVGKHCGFVQFVKKADAERAIEKMQGFPVGGSRIRLSWGRSQYKAAQAAAQAAQAAALQAQFQPPPQVSSQMASMTPEQALLLLQKFGFSGIPDSTTTNGSSQETGSSDAHVNKNGKPPSPFSAEKARAAQLAREGESTLTAFDAYSANYPGRPNVVTSSMDGRHNRTQTLSSFSPFSPDPNLYLTDNRRREPGPFSRQELLPHPSKSYAPGFGPIMSPAQDLTSGSNKVSPTSTRPSSVTPLRYGTYLDSSTSFQVNRAPGRPEGHISRPASSSQPSPAEFGGKEQDLMQDLNGTLASLDLDQAWKGLDGAEAGARSTLHFKSSQSLSQSHSPP